MVCDDLQCAATRMVKVQGITHSNKKAPKHCKLTWMGTMPAFFEMLMPVSPPVKLMQFTAGCVCAQVKASSDTEYIKRWRRCCVAKTLRRHVVRAKPC